MQNAVNLFETPSKSMEEHAHKVKNVDENLKYRVVKRCGEEEAYWHYIKYYI